jgi:site-specific recombinase XerD
MRAESAPYRWNEVARLWRHNRRLGPGALSVYQYWLRRFSAYCDAQVIDCRAELTEQGAERFARWWRSRGSGRRGRLENTIKSSHSALRAWSFALAMLGESVPLWSARRPPVSFDAKFRRFAAYLHEVRGNPPGTIRKKLTQLTAFDRYRRSRGGARAGIRLADIDAYIVDCRRRFARSTVADICSTLRGYLRFLHATGQMDFDLARSVMSPKIRIAERPHRTLPWNDVKRILRAVDRTTPIGRRDYALLLMMSVYGLGAGEVIGLALDDIDWRAATLQVRRPKNGVTFRLPLLPEVARALANYLRRGRPPHTDSRSLFVTMRTPFKRLACSVTVRHILGSAARRAGVTAPFLGTHVLRHTHASRQLDLGTPTKVIGDILGHRDPESTSAYLRVPTDRLRALSLPVPL